MHPGVDKQCILLCVDNLFYIHGVLEEGSVRMQWMKKSSHLNPKECLEESCNFSHTKEEKNHIKQEAIAIIKHNTTINNNNKHQCINNNEHTEESITKKY